MEIDEDPGLLCGWGDDEDGNILTQNWSSPKVHVASATKSVATKPVRSKRAGKRTRKYEPEQQQQLEQTNSLPPHPPEQATIATLILPTYHDDGTMHHHQHPRRSLEKRKSKLNSPGIKASQSQPTLTQLAVVGNTAHCVSSSALPVLSGAITTYKREPDISRSRREIQAPRQLKARHVRQVSKQSGQVVCHIVTNVAHPLPPLMPDVKHQQVDDGRKKQDHQVDTFGSVVSEFSDGFDLTSNLGQGNPHTAVIAAVVNLNQGLSMSALPSLSYSNRSRWQSITHSKRNTHHDRPGWPQGGVLCKNDRIVAGTQSNPTAIAVAGTASPANQQRKNAFPEYIAASNRRTRDQDRESSHLQCETANEKQNQLRSHFDQRREPQWIQTNTNAVACSTLLHSEEWNKYGQCEWQDDPENAHEQGERDLSVGLIQALTQFRIHPSTVSPVVLNNHHPNSSHWLD